MIRFALLFLSLLVFAMPGIAESERPNVVVVLADDLGWADVGFHGAPIETPSIDRIASEGLQLDRFYTAPMCTPTRAMLLTGIDPIRFGLAYEQINPWDNAGVPRGVHFMPESFAAAGYQTAMVGKWHLGHTAETFHPNRRGFDHYYGHLNTAVDYWTHTRRRGLDWQRNGEGVREEGYATDLQGAEAARLIRERDENRPLFLYVAFNAPHNPMQAPEDLIEKYASLNDTSGAPGYLKAIEPIPAGPLRDRFGRARQVYAAMVDSMDRAVGEILKALDDEGIAEETIVLFASDNGGFNIFGGDNAPLRGQKAQSFEGGVRVAAALRWPAKIAAGGVSSQMMTAMDVFPTLAEAVALEPRSTGALDGSSVWGSLASGEAVPRDREFFLGSEVPLPGQIVYAAYHGPWKLVEIDRVGQLPTLRYLFRIDEDPYEERDLSAKHPEVVADLVRRLADWRKLEPAGGLRRHPAPHAGWLPPHDWAKAMLNGDELQDRTEGDFIADVDAAQGGRVNTLIFLESAERKALTEK
jgi:arylsulfatase A-like enzyme